MLPFRLPPWRPDLTRAALHPLVQGVVLPPGGPDVMAEALAVVVRRYGAHAVRRHPFIEVFRERLGVGYKGVSGGWMTILNPAAYWRYWETLHVDVPSPDVDGVELIWRHHPGFVPQVPGGPPGWIGLPAPDPRALGLNPAATLYPALLGEVDLPVVPRSARRCPTCGQALPGHG